MLGGKHLQGLPANAIILRDLKKKKRRTTITLFESYWTSPVPDRHAVTQRARFAKQNRQILPRTAGCHVATEVTRVVSDQSASCRISLGSA